MPPPQAAERLSAESGTWSPSGTALGAPVQRDHSPATPCPPPTPARMGHARRRGSCLPGSPQKRKLSGPPGPAESGVPLHPSPDEATPGAPKLMRLGASQGQRIQNAREDVQSRLSAELHQLLGPASGAGVQRAPSLGRRVRVLVHVGAAAATNTRDGDKPSGYFKSLSFPGRDGGCPGRSRVSAGRPGALSCGGKSHRLGALWTAGSLTLGPRRAPHGTGHPWRSPAVVLWTAGREARQTGRRLSSVSSALSPPFPPSTSPRNFTR